LYSNSFSKQNKDKPIMSAKLFSGAYKWFLLAALPGILFGAYSTIYATGSLNLLSLQQEQWLLYRPQTRLDCIFYEWRALGTLPVSILLTLLLGIICIRSGYRRRVLPLLLLLLLIGTSIEVVGKQLLALPIPATLRSGLTTLACPQMAQQPVSIQVATSFGLWWLIPEPSPEKTGWARDVANMPLTFDRVTNENGYPGGHALRWCFLGLLACWLSWRHIFMRPLKVACIVVTILLAFGGGFMQFYIGSHIIPDTLAGYIMGTALACCAIGLLQTNIAGKPLSSPSAKRKKRF
jgi:hypothetical protein